MTTVYKSSARRSFDTQSSTGLSESSPLLSRPPSDASNLSLGTSNASQRCYYQQFDEKNHEQHVIDSVPSRCHVPDNVQNSNGGDRGDFDIPQHPNNSELESRLERQHQAAIKIDPKVFFSNERTFLAWLHTSVLLAGSSIALSSFSNDTLPNRLYGVFTLSLAIAFICYAMYQYSERSRMMIRASPGPYEDTVGPSILAIMLVLSILAQFTLQIYPILSGW